ncbi:DNA polymerase III subunit gamma/tau [Echinicola strongylocentroti]|uniref:DNA polymerase III subunit gamma/tau n=1 Tax=Echinicola strongylocentroti TaxID=1795355 RepID=A0A2Z4IGL8_9BACT|nr:DNA polymerase III subunit gamma/tau [Echinicola strongylocentroti]AWW29859.1 DNA polymerase III subunit gamma/tau [Echinicola strongylocentroti]
MEVRKTVPIPANLTEAKQQVKTEAVEAQENPVKEESKTTTDQGPAKNNPFDKGKLGAILENAIAGFKQQKRHIEGTLLKQPFEVEENKVKFFLNGELQEHRFAQFKPELIGMLRKKLENYFVEIDFEVKEDAVSEEEKLYTSTDKLAYLSKKSPALKELQKRFGLETDF